jgi:hypothetical protein
VLSDVEVAFYLSQKSPAGTSRGRGDGVMKAVKAARITALADRLRSIAETI